MLVVEAVLTRASSIRSRLYLTEILSGVNVQVCSVGKGAIARFCVFAVSCLGDLVLMERPCEVVRHA